MPAGSRWGSGEALQVGPEGAGATKKEALTTHLYGSRVLHHLDPRVIARFVTFGLGTYEFFSFANRAVLSLQKQNVVLSVLKKKKGLGQLLRRKKVQ